MRPNNLGLPKFLANCTIPTPARAVPNKPRFLIIQVIKFENAVKASIAVPNASLGKRSCQRPVQVSLRALSLNEIELWTVCSSVSAEPKLLAIVSFTSPTVSQLAIKLL